MIAKDYLAVSESSSQLFAALFYIQNSLVMKSKSVTALRSNQQHNSKVSTQCTQRTLMLGDHEHV